MVGIITLARALILRNLVDERDRFEVERRHKVAAVVIGATTGFVIGITSAGSGTVIAILLIAVYRLAPKKVVGTDVFHAAILLWAAGLAHWVGGNVDFGLAGNILLGSVPGVIIGAALSDKAPQGFIRTALGVVLIGSGIVTIQKGDPNVWPIAAAVAGARPRRRSSPRRTGSTGAASGERQARGRPALGALAPDAHRLTDLLAACASQPRPTTQCAPPPSWPPPSEGPVKGERLAEAQDIPLQFLEHILLELKHARHRPRPPRRQGRLLAGQAGRRGDDRRRRPRRRGPDRPRPVDAAGVDRVPRQRRAPAGGLDRRPRQPARRARGGHPRRPRLRRPAARGRGPRRHPRRLGRRASAQSGRRHARRRRR